MMSHKVLLVIPNLGFGGAQRVFSDHSKMFSEICEVDECVFNMSQENVYPTGNRLFNLDVDAGNSFASKFFNFFKRVSRLRRIKKEQKYEVVISHLEGADYVNILSRQKERLVLVVHGSKLADENIQGLIGWIRTKLLLPWLYRKADLIVTVSNGIKLEMMEAYKIPSSKIVSIPNYFDVEEIVEKSQEKKNGIIESLREQNQIILYSGRFAKQKNLIPLITIFKHTLAAKRNIKLVMVGDGELKEDILAECKAQVLTVCFPENEKYYDADVFFMGYQENPFPFIKQSDIFIMTSKWEGFPMALCEAMALGACVVSSDCPTGPRQILDIIDNSKEYTSAGELLPIPIAGQKTLIDHWVNALLILLNDNNKRKIYSLNATDRAKDFDKHQVAKRWMDILF